MIAATTTVAKYVYDNEDILLELNGSNQIVARYTHGPGIDEPLIMEKNSQSFYYHADGLGSIVDVTNQSGGIVQRYTYSSFGQIESRSDPPFVQPYTYTARELDPESTLYYYRARYYDPVSGRVLAEDALNLVVFSTFAQVNSQPNGRAIGAAVLKVLLAQNDLHRHAYAENNAVNKIDSFGLQASDDGSTIIQLVSTLCTILKNVGCSPATVKA